MNEANASITETLALLGRLKADMPEIWSQAEVVGRWVWLEFNTPPLKTVRENLRKLGFHWNRERRSWQHPCGVSRPRSTHDPREVYPVTPASDIQLNDATAIPPLVTTREFKIVALRECPLPEAMQLCDTPEKAAEYWNLHVKTNPYFNPDAECFVVLMLNSRRRVKGHQLLSIGTLDTILVHPREVFRAAIISGGTSALVLMHNHPSGEPEPSEADIRVTRDLIRAGQLLKIDVLDHVIIGNARHCSLRDLGYFL